MSKKYKPKFKIGDEIQLITATNKQHNFLIIGITEDLQYRVQFLKTDFPEYKKDLNHEYMFFTSKIDMCYKKANFKDYNKFWMKFNET